ncbi:unnamed protein product [Heterotrigona itama]|uniref:Small ribosomal subunit protein mS26 n=1 Tax=Heterotrigona itama TaxID=395501 RepID=A0A6V7GU85_9HYME|nr:unnamed protein product [Heterotrigona itama]
MTRLSVLSVNVLTVRNLNAYDHIISNGPYIQCVRWKRKPIWLSPAKSKLFRVPERKVIPIEESIELKRLHNNYRTYMKSLMTFFIETEKEKELCFDKLVVEKNAQKDFEICSQINDKWNTKVAMMREKRLIQEREDRQKEILDKVQAKKERDSKLLEKIDEEIRKAKEEAKTFITSENIDKAIVDALENITEHNVAIDLKDNFIKKI